MCSNSLLSRNMALLEAPRRRGSGFINVRLVVLVCLAANGIFVVGPDAARAANLIWDNGGTGTAWATAGNWAVAPGGTDQAPVSGDSLYYTSTSNTGFNQTNDLAVDTQLNGIFFGVVPASGSGTASVGGFNIGGNKIVLNGDMRNSTSNSTGVQRINFDIDLSGSRVIYATASVNLNSGGATEDFIFGGTFGGSGSLFVRGDGVNGKVVFNGPLNHTSSFGMTDANTQVTLNAVNGYTGGTNVARGTLVLGVNDALPLTTVVTLGQNILNANAATLNLNGKNQEIAGLQAQTGANNNETHTVTSATAATLTINNSADYSFGSVGNNVITGAISLVKQGNGTQTLTGTNTYNGATTINDGTLQIGNGTNVGAINNSTNVSIDGGATLRWFRNDSGAEVQPTNNHSGAGTLHFLGTNSNANLTQGRFTLTTQDNSAFSGTIIAEKARVVGTQANDFGTATLQVDTGGQFLFNAGTYANDIVINNSTGWYEGGALNLGALRANGSGINLTGDIALNHSNAVVLGDNSGQNSVVTAYSQPTSFNLSGVISGNGEFSMNRYTAWNGGSAADAGFTFSGSSSNTYTGKTVVNGQRVGGATFGAYLILNKTAGAKAIQGGTTVQMGNNTGGQAQLIMGGNEQFGTNDGGVQMNFVNASGQWMRFSLMGTTQTLAGIDSSYISGGSAQAGAVIQNARPQAGVATDATLKLNGSGTYIYNGFLRDFDNINSGGKLNLIKEGSGTQTLVGNQLTYTGSTTVNSGILAIAGTGSLLNTPLVTIGSSGTLELGGSGNNQLSSNAASSTWDISGTLRVTSGTAHTLYATTINLNNGTMDSTGGTVGGPAGGASGQYGAFFAGANRTITANGANNHISGNGSFGINNGASLTLNTPLVGDTLTGSVVFGVGNSGTAGGLAKSGAGTVILSGNNAYTGTTTINAGMLLVNGTHTGGNTYTVGSNGTLGGGGVITAAVNVLGTISPGNSIDLLTTGSETWNNGTTYEWEVSQAGIAGVDYDSIDVTGTLNFSSVTAGGITLELLASPPLGAIQMNDTFALWTYQSLVGWDAAVGASSSLFTILDTGGFNGNPIIYADNLSGPGTIWLTHLVPEPQTLALGLLGLVGVALLGRRRNGNGRER